MSGRLFALAKAPLKRAVLEIAKMSGGFALARRRSARHLRVLAYHGLWITPGFQFGNRLFIDPEQFRRRMTWLRNSRYRVLPLDEAIDALAAGSLPDYATVITIDDGWRSTYTHMLPILEELQLPATVYVTTWYVVHRSPVLNVALQYVMQRSPVSGFTWTSSAHPPLAIHLNDHESRERAASMITRLIEDLPSLDARQAELREICRLANIPTEPWWSEGQFHLMTPEEIAAARARGLDIQLHTHRHTEVTANIATLPDELADNQQALMAACGSDEFRHFCYPCGDYDKQAAAVLCRAGIRSAMLCDQGINPPGADPYALRRFLDGRCVPDQEFEAYLSGV
ncbi:MAG: polysaccharide deacetylase family protein, partial [Alphaproteobacteria bacterium]|nr:polysaccharide deacetylase family protein [Alphaproteobacteria bacterium]